MNIRALKLRDANFKEQWFDEVHDRWEYDDFTAHPGWRRDWISFDSTLYNPDDDRIYLGITSFDADIFRAYDRNRGEFVDLGYSRIAHPQDAKFHRSLVKWERDGCLYGAIALLHDIDRYWDAPGGAIVRYDPRTGAMEKIGIPLPHIYIQSICLDQARGVLYGMTFTPERFFAFDLATCQATDLGPISSGFGMAQGENVELDAEGCAWCGWSVTRAWQSTPGPDAHRLCKYDPALGRLRFFDAGLPRPDGAYGYAKVEGLFNLGGRLYASGANGSLFRVDADTGQGTYLGTPIADRPSRLTSLALGPDDAAYGVTGRGGCCEVLRFDLKTETYALLGPVADGDEHCFQVHHVSLTPDGVLYAGENDHPRRSGYLWEITL
jgi:hypothetical protein